MTPRSLIRAGVVLLAVAVSCAAFAMRTPYVGFFHDDGLYVVTAKALAEGRGYRIISVPGEPVQTKYPPLYPLLLSLVLRVRGGSTTAAIGALKCVGILALGASVLCSAGLWRRYNPRGHTAALFVYLVIGACNAVAFSTADFTLSDSVFAFLFAAALLAHPLENPSMYPSRRVVGAALLSGLALATKQTGVALIIGGVVWAFLAGPRVFRVYLSTTLVVVGALALFRHGAAPAPNPLVAYYTEYELPVMLRLARHPGEALSVVTANVTYVWLGASLLFVELFPGVRWIVTLVFLAGVGPTLRTGGRYLQVVTVFYFAMILVYPFHPLRYVLPVLPLMLIAMFRGASDSTAFAATRLPRGARGAVGVVVSTPFAVAVLACVAWLQTYVPVDPGSTRIWLGLRPQRTWTGFEETFDWIRSHTRDQDVLGTAYDPMYYLYTGRTGVRPWLHKPETYFYPRGRSRPDIGQPAQVLRALDAVGVTYLVADPLDGYAERDAFATLFNGMLAELGPRATLVFISSDGQHRVYRVERPPAMPAS